MLDITPQKHAEEMLRVTNDDLEMRVLTRTAELAEANEMMGLEIGERRRIEQELRDAEQRFRTLVEHVPGVVYTWRVPPPGERELYPETYVSPHVEVMLGYRVDEWRSPGFWETRVHPHDRERVMAATRRSRETGEEFHEEFRYLAKDGSVVWVLDHASLTSRNDDGSPRIFQGVMVEVTDRKLAEEKAAAAEEQFQLIAERGPFVVYRYDFDPQASPSISIRYLSPSASQLLGMPSDRWPGDLEAWMDLLHPDDVERMRRAAADALSTGGPWSHTFRMISGDGRVVWLLDRGQAIGWDERGRPRRFQGVFLDVTDEQETLLDTRASLSRYRSVVESMPAVPWTEVVDPQSGASRYEFLGGQVGAVFGYTPEELQMEPDHFFRLVHPDDRERLRAASDRCDRTGRPWDELYRVVHRDGTVHWILSTATRSFEDDRPVWHGVSLDVTGRIGVDEMTSFGREPRSERD
jgi:PAS domain S-box-containing protein